ncbi:MAG: hypothetical protein JST79_14665 [Acidobacteria bacterium]|nr:hypothetical protein [Acidobacteriota bacterium]
MKTSRMWHGAVLAMALLLATSAFAINKGSLQVQDNLTVSGTSLAPGDYSVQWDGNGPSVQVSILKGKKVVATVPAQVVDLKEAPGINSAVVTRNADGSRTLQEIRFSGKRFALAMGEAHQGGSN